MVLWVLNISKVGTNGPITLNPTKNPKPYKKTLNPKKIQITTQHGSPPSEVSNMDREVATRFQQCTPNGGHVSLMCTHFFFFFSMSRYHISKPKFNQE